MKLQITFKGGAQIEVDVNGFTSGRNGMGELASLRWETPDDWTAKLHRVELDEIAAIVALREPGEALAEPDGDPS